MFSARVWREIPQRYRLEASKCKKCGKIFFPPRLVCDGCHAREFESVNLPWEGTIVSYTVIHTPPTQFKDESPYAIGIVEVAKGVRLTCQIVDANVDKLQIGQKVLLEFRCIQKSGKNGVLCYGYKAVPVGVHNSIE